MASEQEAKAKADGQVPVVGRMGDNDDDDQRKGGDNSWLDFEASPGPGRGHGEKGQDMDRRIDMGEKEDKEGKVNGSPNGSAYAALKGQGVRMKPKGDAACKDRWKVVVDNDDGEDEGSDFF